MEAVSQGGIKPRSPGPIIMGLVYGGGQPRGQTAVSSYCTEFSVERRPVKPRSPGLFLLALGYGGGQ